MSQSETIVGLGARTDHLAQVPQVDLQRLRLTMEEARLFEQIGRAARIDEVLSRAGMEESRAIAVLLSLRAKGAVVPARVSRPSHPTVVDAAMAEQVDLPEDRKKEILDLERGLDRLDHFAVLGLRPGATPEEAKQAWYDASRRYHPDRYFGKNIGSFRSRIERIFRRVTEAYNVLSDPQKRSAYLKAHPELAAPPPSAPGGSEAASGGESTPLPLDPARAAERRARMARHPYLVRQNRLTELISRARAHIEQGEPGMAYTDLHLASQLDPQNREVQTLLADARRRHESARAEQELQRSSQKELVGDLKGALEHLKNAVMLDPQNAKAALRAAQLSMQLGGDPRELRALGQRAVELNPKNPDAHVLLASILAEAGTKKLAKKHLDEALTLKPEHAEAKRLSRKLRWPFAGL